MVFEESTNGRKIGPTGVASDSVGCRNGRTHYTGAWPIPHGGLLGASWEHGPILLLPAAGSAGSPVPPSGGEIQPDAERPCDGALAPLCRATHPCGRCSPSTRGSKARSGQGASFHVLQFDPTGALDADAYQQQELRRAAATLTPALAARSPARTDSAVVDATDGFAARGGSWTPSKALARAIEAAALGRVPCARL